MRVRGTLIRTVDHRQYGGGIVVKWALPYHAEMRGKIVESVEFDDPIMQSMTLVCGDIDSHMAMPTDHALSGWVDTFFRSESRADCMDEAAEECEADYEKRNH